MNSLNTFCILFFLSIFSATCRPLSDELIIRLEDDEKLVGTFSGDIDQEVSVHLIVVKKKKDDQYLVRPFFIDANKNIIALETSLFMEKPAVVSYHKKNDMLTLLFQQGKRKEEKLEILEYNILQGDYRRITIDNFKEPYLLMRTGEKTFLLNKENHTLELTTVTGVEGVKKSTLNFSNDHKELEEKIFKLKPDPINTGEFVEHGSINPSKLYFSNEKLFFDYKSEDEYFTFIVEPAGGEYKVFKTEFKDIDQVREVNAFVYRDKSFLFINNKEDLILRIYDINTEQLLGESNLWAQFSENDDLKKIIKKSARKNFSLTASVNEGEENTFLINLDYVPTYEYFYHYNWWWHHMMFQSMMMQQQMMIQQQMLPKTRGLPFGPNAVEDGDLYFSSPSQPVQLVMDQNFKFLKTSAAKPVRPYIDKSKYLDVFKNNNKLKEETVSFTTGSVRAIYFSEVTDAVHLKVFDR